MMKSKSHILALGLILTSLILGVLLISGCSRTTPVQSGPIQGSGNIVIENRPVRGFDRVSLDGPGEVLITQGREESLSVEADDNLMPYIKTEVRNGTLTLGFTDEARNKRIQPSQEIKFNLRLKNIARLDISGTGSISASSLDADRLKIIISGAGDANIGSLTARELVIRISGTGNAELAGQVVEQEIEISGSGAHHAAQLKSQTVVVEVSGAGSATLWVTEALDVRISGVGNIEYYGRPRVTQKLSGLGELVNMGDR